ncbi:hypothetical protein HK096_009494, partial [Nowakowskiella sp. JEL0078]
MSTPTLTYLRSLQAIRERTTLLLTHPDKLRHFTVVDSQISDVVEFVLSLIKRDYKVPADIPPHSRWRHFEASTTATPIDRITPLMASWDVDATEKCRRLLDLFVVSVLLDAGAGDSWHYGDYARSEGLALASLDWFSKGGFSSSGNKFQADAAGLKSVSVESLEAAFLVSVSNPLVGVEGRTSLLNRLGAVCAKYTLYFGKEGRPGCVVDYLIAHSNTIRVGDSWVIQIETLWEVVMEAFSEVWPPTRTKLNGVSLGDVWPCEAMREISEELSEPGKSAGPLVAFHKLSQWLTYSLMEPMALIGIKFKGVDKMTGLAEYRNGGLFVDFGVLKLKDTNKGEVPKFHVHDEAVVEWRALTIALLDIVAERVRDKLGMNVEELPLAKVLEAGTWKAGREIAKKIRPLTKGPPIEIISDGT